MRFFLFFSTVLLFTFLMHYFIYRQFRFAFALSPEHLWFKIIFVFLALWYLLSVIIGRRYPSEITELNLKFASYWLGFSFYFFIFGLLAELIVGLSSLLNLPKTLSFSFSLFRQLVFICSLILAGTISIFAIQIAKKDFIIRTIEVPIRHLSPDLDSTKVVLISDLHIGAVNREKFVQRLVSTINSRSPDLVVIPGDIADGDPYRLKEKLSYLKNLQTKYGVFWSLGNHEYYTGLQTVQDALNGANLTLLQNNYSPIADGKLILAGVNDPTDRIFGGEGIQLDQAIPNSVSAPIILLSHQPLYVKQAFEKGVSLMVCGHTHGGQTWPANLIVDSVWEYPRGLFQFANGVLYVSVGVGTWGPPMRLTQPPEIVEFILRQKNQ